MVKGWSKDPGPPHSGDIPRYFYRYVSDEGTVVKEAGMFFDGLKEYHCTECGELLNSEVLPSQYPTYYLYILIGVGCAIIVAIATMMIIRKRKSEKEI